MQRNINNLYISEIKLSKNISLTNEEVVRSFMVEGDKFCGLILERVIIKKKFKYHDELH
jgi:hypothetical protein